MTHERALALITEMIELNPEYLEVSVGNAGTGTSCNYQLVPNDNYRSSHHLRTKDEFLAMFTAPLGPYVTFWMDSKTVEGKMSERTWYPSREVQGCNYTSYE